MNYKISHNNKSKIDYIKYFNLSNKCNVSKASVEIMLDRFCNGKAIEFPFS